MRNAAAARVDEILAELAGMRWKGEPISTPYIQEALEKLRAEVRRLANVAGRSVVAASTMTVEGDRVDVDGRPVLHVRPVAFLDNGDVVYLDLAGKWMKLPHVPGTEFTE